MARGATTAATGADPTAGAGTMIHLDVIAALTLALALAARFAG